MKTNRKADVLLCGVGGQGVLTVAGVLATAAMEDELTVRQSEVHGMAQRGGAVVAHLRISDGPISGDLIPRGKADLILAMEPLEALRYREYLSDQGLCITATDPFPNIPDYPTREWLAEALRSTYPRLVTIDADDLGREVGSVRARNIIMVGAAVDRLPVTESSLQAAVRMAFEGKGQALVAMNLDALKRGQAAAKSSAMTENLTEKRG